MMPCTLHDALLDSFPRTTRCVVHIRHERLICIVVACAGACSLVNFLYGAAANNASKPHVHSCCRGRPDGLVVCHLPFGPTAYFGLHNCVTRHDIGSKAEVGTISEVNPNLILENFSTPLGRRFATILKALFPVPKPTNKRIVTFANQSDFISMRCDARSFESHTVMKQDLTLRVAVLCAMRGVRGVGATCNTVCLWRAR